MKRTIGTLILIFGTAAFVGCGAKKDPIECGEDALAEFADVRYTSDIAPILATYCLLCHDQRNTGTARNSAPVGVDFDTYAGVNVWSDRIVARAATSTMPPSGNNVRLDDRCRLIAWQDGGFVQ